MDNKEMKSNREELNLNEMEKAAGGVEDGPGRRDKTDKSGFIDLIVDLFKKLF